MNKYIILLRGINVGGNNIIKMEQLRLLLEEIGFTQVKTYIQSGNIIVETDITQEEKVASQVQNSIFKEFNLEIPVLVLFAERFLEIAKNAPKNFGEDKDKYKFDVIFLFPGTSSEEVIEQIEINQEVDSVYSGNGAVYFSRLTEKLSKSKLHTLIAKKKIYNQVTIRNWNTTLKLAELLE